MPGKSVTDHKFEDCPKDDCDGVLQYQTQADAECQTCGEVYTHEIRTDRHLLWELDNSGAMTGVVARAH